MKHLQSWEESNSPPEPELRLSPLKSCFRTSSSEEEDGDGALQAGKGWHQASIPVIRAAGERDLTNRSFQPYWNAKYLF